MAGVTFALTSVKSATSKAGNDGCFLVLRPTSDHSGGELLDILAEAVARANEAANTGAELHWLAAPAGAVKGGVAVAVSRHEFAPADPRPWLDPFVAVLDKHGVTGKITMPGRKGVWAEDGEWERAQQRLYPALYLSHPLADPTVDPNAPHSWLGSPAATRARAKDAVARCFTPTVSGEQITAGYAKTLTSMVGPQPEFAATTMAATASVAQWCGVVTWSDHFAFRQAYLRSPGAYVVSLAEARTPWVDLVRRLRASLVVEPTLAVCGFVRNSRWYTTMLLNMLVEEAGQLRPQEPGISGTGNLWDNSGRWDQNCHLHGEYVLDAHGINLLTSAHLDHAHDLSGWDVSEVGEDRYLVEANDLEPWFNGKPDPAVVDGAREDFGDMLITWDAVLQNPGPMTVFPHYLPQPSGG